MHTRAVRQVELSYSLGTSRSEAATIRNPLMDLLLAIRDHGSISGAAKALDLSYRHVWGELKRWEIRMTDGQFASLEDRTVEKWPSFTVQDF